MEQWEIDFRKRCKENLSDGSFNTPAGVLNKEQYTEYQVEKEKRHRRLVEEEKNGIKDKDTIDFIKRHPIDLSKIRNTKD